MMHQLHGYAYVWRYVVRPESIEDFKKAYGPGGPWVALFTSAPGYIRTELYGDMQDPRCFLTIDYWETVETWEAFRAAMAVEFETIDHMCAGFTLEEKQLGQLSMTCGDAVPF